MLTLWLLTVLSQQDVPIVVDPPLEEGAPSWRRRKKREEKDLADLNLFLAKILEQSAT